MKAVLLTAAVVWRPAALNAMTIRLGWLPEGRMRYEAFSVNPNRRPDYLNSEMSKSFFWEALWRHPAYPEFGIDLRAVQFGRTLALERVGNYQSAPMRISVQAWQLVAERDLASGPNGFLAGMAGMGVVTNQFERSRHILINGVDVSSEVGLDPSGTQRSGIRVSIENFALPLGARWQQFWSPSMYTETVLNYSFLMDLTDVFSGSSPFSGWASQARVMLGWKLGSSWEVFGGGIGYVNHMAAPTGQGGLRLRGGPQAPEGIYVLWQENEVRMSAAFLGVGFSF